MSILLGGAAFTAARSPRRRIILVSVLNCVSIGGALALALVSGKEATRNSELYLRFAFLFLAASGMGVSCYIPHGMFAVVFGGRSSGVVSAYLDAVAYIVVFVWLLMLKHIIDSVGWVVVWFLIAAFNCLTLVITAAFLQRLLKADATASAV